VNRCRQAANRSRSFIFDQIGSTYRIIPIFQHPPRKQNPTSDLPGSPAVHNQRRVTKYARRRKKSRKSGNTDMLPGLARALSGWVHSSIASTPRRVDCRCFSPGAFRRAPRGREKPRPRAPFDSNGIRKARNRSSSRPRAGARPGARPDAIKSSRRAAHFSGAFDVGVSSFPSRRLADVYRCARCVACRCARCGAHRECERAVRCSSRSMGKVPRNRTADPVPIVSPIATRPGRLHRGNSGEYFARVFTTARKCAANFSHYDFAILRFSFTIASVHALTVHNAN